MLQEQTRSGKSVGQILNDFEILDTESQLQVLAEHLGTEVVHLGDRDLPPDLIQLIPPASARLYRCVPIEANDSSLKVALAEPLNPAVLDELAFVVRREIQVVVADPEEIERAVNKYYGGETGSVTDVLDELGSDTDSPRKSPRQPRVPM